MSCEYCDAAICVEDGVAKLQYVFVSAGNGGIDDVVGLMLCLNKWCVLFGVENGGIGDSGTELFAPTGMLQLVGTHGP